MCDASQLRDGGHRCSTQSCDSILAVGALHLGLMVMLSAKSVCFTLTQGGFTAGGGRSALLADALDAGLHGGILGRLRGLLAEVVVLNWEQRDGGLPKHCNPSTAAGWPLIAAHVDASRLFAPAKPSAAV